MGFSTAILASGYGVMFTVLADFRDKLHISEGALGFIVGIGFLTSFAAQVLLAPFADRGHARMLVLVGALTAFGGTVVIAFGTSLIPLLLGRIFMGIGVGMASPAVRRILILAEPENVGSNLGRLLSVDVAGFAIGPIISALTVSRFGLRAPFLIIAAATLAVIPFLLRIHVDEHVTAEGAISMPSQRLAFDLLRIRPIVGAMCFGIALMTMIGTFDTLWSVVMTDMRAPDWMTKVGITVFAVPLIFIGPLGGRLVEKHGPFRLAALGLVVASCCVSLYGLLTIPWTMLLVGAFHAMNDGFTVSGAGVGVAVVAPEGRQAGAQGLLGGAQTLAGGLSAIVAGWSYHRFGRASTFVGCTVFMLALVALGAKLCGPAMRTKPRTVLVPATTGEPAFSQNL
jgi:MFS family permease